MVFLRGGPSARRHGIIGLSDDHRSAAKPLFLFGDIDRQDGDAAPHGQHGGPGLGLARSAVLDASALREEKHFFPAFQELHRLLDGAHIGFAPVHAEYAGLAQEPANHGYPDQLGFRHGADLMLEPEGEYQKKGIRSRRVVGADQHAALRDVLPADGPAGVHQIKKGKNNTVKYGVNGPHWPSFLLIVSSKASKLSCRDRPVVSTAMASSA